MKLRCITLLILSSAMLVTSSCGSSSSSPTVDTVHLAAAANPICMRMIGTLHHLFKINDFKSIPAIAATTAASLRRYSDELANLKPPASMSGEWNEIVDGYRTVATDVSELGEHAKVTTKPDVPALAQLTQAQGAAAATAARYGIAACSVHF